MDRQRWHSLLRKVHSSTGILPVGVFLFTHLATSSTALDGRVEWNLRFERNLSFWGLPFVEWSVILVPLCLHALVGSWLLLRRQVDDAPLASAPTWSSAAQRVTGVLALAFIVLHLWEYRVQRAVGALARDELHDRLAASLDGRLIFVAYLVGVSAAVFHFANGLWRFSVRSGIARTKRQQRVCAVAFGIGGALCWIGWLDVLAYFHSGGPLLGWLAGAAP